MIPNAKGFLNRFQFVKMPSVRDLYLRVGSVMPPNTTSTDDGSVLPDRKNDISDLVNEYADQVPVQDPENPSE